MSYDAAQETEIEVTATVTRLVPCPEHEGTGSGEMVWNGNTPVRNPNGYRHDCDACAATPPRYQTLEPVLTRNETREA